MRADTLITVIVSTYNRPDALVHGDLHPGNVAMRDGSILLFDWTDASVSHPFFDLMHLFHAEPAVQARLRDSYFEAWTSFEPLERLFALGCQPIRDVAGRSKLRELARPIERGAARQDPPPRSRRP